MAAEWYSGHTDVVNDLFVESFPEKVLSWLRPVIDRAYGTNGAVFPVAMSNDAQGAYHHRLHALDLTTGRWDIDDSAFFPFD